MDYWTHAATVTVDPDTGTIANGGLAMHLGGSDFGLAEQLDAPVYNTSGDYSSLMFARKASAWIEEHAQRKPKTPMFLYLAFQGCHSGDNLYVQAPDAYIERVDAISPNHTCGSWTATKSGDCTAAAMRKSVAAAASVVDDAIGDVVRSLRRASMYGNSLIVVSTDNGGPTAGADHNMMNNFPLRGCKGGYFEGGVRGVGLIHGVGLWRTGVVLDEMLHVNDWMHTLLSAASAGATGAPHVLRLAPNEPPLMPGDGMDNWAVFSAGVASKRTEIIHVTQVPGSVMTSEALRVGELKLLWNPAGTDCSTTHPGWYPPPGLAWDYATFTVKCSQPPETLDECTAEAPCLFNITSDPCEHTNLARAMPDAVEIMQARLAEYRATAVLPWNQYSYIDPRADPSHFGPVGEYNGVMAPWLTDEEAATYYPSNYTGEP